MIADRSKENSAAAADPSHRCAVGLLLLLTDEGSQSSIEHLGRWAHAPCGTENKGGGGEHATLNLLNSLIICSSLLFLMLLVAGT